MTSTAEQLMQKNQEGLRLLLQLLTKLGLQALLAVFLR
jgi:hypothetical protein